MLLNTMSTMEIEESHNYEEIAKCADSAPLPPPQRRPLSSLRPDTDTINVLRNPAYIAASQTSKSLLVGSEYEIPNDTAHGHGQTQGLEYSYEEINLKPRYCV